MASRKTYECFVCQKMGFDVQVFLDGKDEKGHTKYLESDGVTKHVHKGQQPEEQYEDKIGVHLPTGSTQESQQQPSLAQILQILQGLESKIDHLTKLFYAQSQSQQQKEPQQ